MRWPLQNDDADLIEPLWDWFNGGAEGTRWYYGALARVFSTMMRGRLSDRLSRAVVDFSA
jgi:hypothetical protein